MSLFIFLEIYHKFDYFITLWRIQIRSVGMINILATISDNNVIGTRENSRANFPEVLPGSLT
jgi:hypothetical protein